MAKGYYKYFNRDISWLSYDSLVLESAKQSDASIGEMLNFISFHSSNLDEFYSVRVAEYRRTAYGDSRMDEVSNPAAMLHRINSIVSSQMIEARDTKLGPEEITREIPNVGDDMLGALDERGIIHIGAEVHSGDILVAGKE